jgi:hypothetical protein
MAGVAYSNPGTAIDLKLDTMDMEHSQAIKHGCVDEG